MTNSTEFVADFDSANLVERYHKAMAVYTSTIEGAKRLHGKDFYEAQLRVVDAHFGFEQARQEFLGDPEFIH